MNTGGGADDSLLEKLVLGQLSTAELEQLAAAHADDERVTRLAESLGSSRDRLLDSLRQHRCAPPDAAMDQLARRLVQRVGSVSVLESLAAPQQPDEVGRLGTYRILKVVGAGGMGVVLLAEDSVLKRRVAVKVMRPEVAADSGARQRFLREARAVAAIDDPHIIPIHQVGEENGMPFLVMPLLEGESLARRLERAGRLPVGDVVSIGRQVAAGLAVAHQRGLIHRDIKPANIWLGAAAENSTSAVHVRILDFGLVRSTTGQDERLTQSGTIVGTPVYMAPEQARNQPLDGRCDLFSLGVVLYQSLTGKLPFAADDPVGVLIAVATEEPQKIEELNPEVAPALSALVMRLLAKDAASRPAAASAVAAALAKFQDATPLTCPGFPSPGAPHRLPRLPRRATLVAAAGLATLILLVLLLRPRGPRPGVETTDTVPGSAPRHEGQVTLLANALGMEFVRVPKGKGWLGGEFANPGVGEVDVPYDFYLGRYEVTQEEWLAVMGRNPSKFSRGGEAEVVKKFPDEELKRFPVEQVSWNDAQRFLEALNQREQTAGWTYDLPTEAEWEYACRGGPADANDDSERLFSYFFAAPSHETLPQQANFRGVAWLGRPEPVGRFQANRLGLHDMHGNVAEWCAGDESAAGKSPRVYRGGSYLDFDPDCKATSRGTRDPAQPAAFIGLRLARVPVGVARARFNPGLSADRRAAIWVLFVGGTVRVNEQNEELKARVELRQQPFRLTSVSLANNPQVDDAGLTHFPDCRNLIDIDLTSTKVSDAGLAHLKQTKVLKSLRLGFTQVGDAGLGQLGGHDKLSELLLDNTSVSNAGLARLNDCKNLAVLSLKGTKVTAGGVEALRKVLPSCKIVWAGGTSPKP